MVLGGTGKGMVEAAIVWIIITMLCALIIWFVPQFVTAVIQNNQFLLDNPFPLLYRELTESDA